MKRAETDRQLGGGGRRGSRAGRLARRSLGLVGLFAVMLLVVGVGLGVRSPEPQERVHSVSEQAQLDAEYRYRAAADRARRAAADPGLPPETTAELAAVAVDLDEQADAVALPRSSGPTTEDGSSPHATPHPDGQSDRPGPATAPAAGTDGSADAAPADAPAVLTALRDSALRSLRDAALADPGPGRVLAAAGVNQWRHALQLGHTLGMDPGLPAAGSLSPVDLATGTGPFAALAAPAGQAGAAPTGSAVPTAPVPTTPVPTTPVPTAPVPTAPAECAGTPLGPDADRQALLNARTAEDQARYAYEVAAALIPEPARALDAASTHREAADAAADRLAALCVPTGPTPAGYAIGPDFRDDPVAAMQAIEQDHTELYAGLIATVGPEARAWAVTSFSAAAQRSLDAGAPLEALPGLAGSAPAPDAAPAQTPEKVPVRATEQPGG
ncbi:DUF4439 domain-containing protein [Arthrobacter sp. SX1312]|uniref:DUF4439 domain-containing protein n=1 Tax=Arthrobacter sp. SX1312 TaxID=2058896 RepID=UPI000CE57236|nr:DUF4439 domain-containing protein [Arthrobacter sp. SX1312]